MVTVIRNNAPPNLSAASYPEQGKWTFEDWEKLPDDGYRYEVIDGVLYMTPPPNFVKHQRPALALATAMSNFVNAHHLGEVGIAPAGVRLPTQPVPVQPDIFFIAAGRADVQIGQYVEGAPDLVVEILSPSNWLYDRQEKFKVYQDAGVREYWIVDPRAQTVETFVLQEGAYTLVNKWGAGARAQSQVLPGFEIGIAELFAE